MDSPHIELCITPSIPPQPSPFTSNQLQTLSDLRSKIEENAAALSLLRRQLKSIHELTELIEHKIMEYNLEASYLRCHSGHLGVHSIDKLPPEVLTVIFDFCRTDFLPIDNIHYSREFKYDKAPWILSWVCTRWRLIVLQTSELWSDIPGPVRLFSHQFNKADHNIFKAVCDRSQLSLLRATVITIRQPFQPLGSPWCQLLMPRLSRIKELTFRLELSSMQMEPHWYLPPVELSSLRTLSLQHWDFPGHATAPHNNNDVDLLFRKMPRLENLIIRSPSIRQERLNFSDAKLPWTQLTSVALHGVALVAARTILLCADQLLRLHILDIRSLDEYVPQSTHQKSLSHQNLEQLHLDFPRGCEVDTLESTEDAELFFNTITLPRLNDLSVTHPCQLPSSVLSNFLERSQCSLMDVQFPAVDTIAPLLRLCPDVKRIVLDGAIGDDDLKMLSRPDGEDWLVPRLENITLHSPRMENSNSLIDLIQGRRLANSVRDLQRIDMKTISTARGCKEFTIAVWQPPDLIPYHCDGDIADILKVRCGYELVNDSSVTEKLGRFTDVFEKLEITRRDYQVAFLSEVTRLLRRLLKIYELLDEVDNLELLYPAAFTSKGRLRKALQRFTHDPWIFDIPPPGWVRTPTVGYGVGLLSYVAPPGPIS